MQSTCVRCLLPIAFWSVLVDGTPAAKYLSEFDFPGLHIIERDGEALRLYPNGRMPQLGDASLRIPSANWRSMEGARRALEAALHIPPREPLQTDWALFDAQGRRLESLESFQQAAVAFLLEIGQWMWPAVRIGFEHIAEGVDGDTPKKLRTLSLRPVVFEVEDFIQARECDEIVALGKRRGLVASKGMMQSGDLEKGTSDDDFRTSKQTWLSNYDGTAVAALDGRTANLTRVPASHNEPVQVLRYDESNYYHSHMDWAELELYPDQQDMWMSSHFGHQDRLATVFWYLNTVEHGGETIFPKHGQVICPRYEHRNCPGAPDPDMASCSQGLKVTPRRGTVVLWYNYHPNGRGDRNALHAGCPVGEGLVKWSGNKWVNIKPVDSPAATWNDSHPALKRCKWTGEKGKTKPRDPNECGLVFHNKAKVEVDVLWLGDGKDHALLKLEPGKSSPLNSFRGHEFKLRQSSDAGQGFRKESNVLKVKCREAVDNLYLTDQFRLGMKKRTSSEL